MIPFLVLVFVAAGLLIYLGTLYNGLVALRNDIDKAWANIDVLLKQRHDELPRLADVCKGELPRLADVCKGYVTLRLM